jgi:oxygen-independent coproporphyrinogen-3 oxidase
MAKDPRRVNFSYRDNLWRGADLIATGVSSFGHVAGVHYQNQPEWAEYLGALDSGELPVGRALKISSRQALIREMLLQLKHGYLQFDYFLDKFGVDVGREWGPEWDELVTQGLVAMEQGSVRLTRAGLLRVDAILPRFFEPQYRGIRYT